MLTFSAYANGMTEIHRALHDMFLRGICYAWNDVQATGHKNIKKCDLRHICIILKKNFVSSVL